MVLPTGTNLRSTKAVAGVHADPTSPQSFSLHSVEGNLLGDLIDFESFLGLHIIQSSSQVTDSGPGFQNMYLEVHSRTYSAKGVGEVIRVTFREESVRPMSEGELSKDELVGMFMKEYATISFLGITSAYNIKPSVAYELLNLSLFFRKENLHLSANEVDLCLSLALANDQKVSMWIDVIDVSGKGGFGKMHQLSRLLHQRHHRA